MKASEKYLQLISSPFSPNGTISMTSEVFDGIIKTYGELVRLEESIELADEYTCFKQEKEKELSDMVTKLNLNNIRSITVHS